VVPIEIELMRSVFLLFFCGIVLYLHGYILWLPLLGLPWQGAGRTQDALITGVLLIFFIAFGAAGLYSARGLLLGRSSAWTLSLDLSVVELVTKFFFQIEKEITEPYLSAMGATWYLLYVADVLMLIYLTRPQVKAFYHQE